MIKIQHTKIMAIGILDSGVGGFSVLKALQKVHANENIIYLADLAFAPYGLKTPEQIQHRTRQLLLWMCTQGIQFCVIACHTLSAMDLSQAPCPLIHMIPAAVEAVQIHSFQKGLGIVSTVLSAHMATLRDTLRTQGFSLPIHTQACPDVASLIEDHQWTLAVKQFKQHMKFFNDYPVDAVLYGCTHYPLMEAHLKSLSMPMIDPATQIAQHVVHKVIKGLPPVVPSLELYYTVGSHASDRDIRRRISRHLAKQGLDNIHHTSLQPLISDLVV